MKKRGKILSSVSVLAVMGGTLTGCASNSGNTSNSGGGTDSSKPVTVTIMSWETAAMNKLITQSFKSFEAQNPTIKVKIVPAPLTNYGTKLNGMIAAHQAPDIFELGNDMEQQMGEQGQLYDWYSTAKGQSNFLNNFFPGVLTNWEEDGKLYGLPGLLNVYGYFYNKTLFDEAKIPYPKTGWTYQEMFQDAQKLQKTVDGVHEYGLYAPYDDPFEMGLYSVSAGGAPFANSITNATKIQASPQFIQGLQLYQQNIKNGAVTPPTFDATNIVSMFEQGKVPIMAYGQWAADQLIREAPKSLKWGYVANPIVKSQDSIYDCVGWASPANVPDPSATFKVLKYLDTVTYEKVLPKTPVAPPAYTPAAKPYYNVLKKDGYADMVTNLDYMLNSPNKQPIRFLETWSTKANQFITADWNNLLEDKTPISTVNSMVDKINQSTSSP
ncbi:ABC transporter substrate-binding protein [Alicyclobacillus fodiniaquatilis]|uniref:ABC transporter substrate-binding protein n=1 Tax=Alicyclobacillus fodiniaquatilis TaxID=1661150 RepID=A0ABW4JHN2_9BACL